MVVVACVVCARSRDVTRFTCFACARAGGSVPMSARDRSRSPVRAATTVESTLTEQAQIIAGLEARLLDVENANRELQQRLSTLLG